MAQALLLLVCIICVRLKKSYKELATNGAGEHKRFPKDLYETLKHTVFLNVFLEAIAYMAFAFFVLYSAFSYGTVLALAAIFASLVAVFVVLPKLRPAAAEKKLAVYFSKPFSYFLKKLDKPVSWLERSFEKLSRRLNEAQPLSKKAIQDFLKEQEYLSPDETKADLRLALAALDLNTQKSGYFMVRLAKAKSVDVEEEIGPVLLSELHDTGRKIFAARENDGIVGTLRLDKLVELKSGGKAAKALDRQMVVVNKDEPVLQVIERFVESGAEMVFAEDETGKTAGVIYLEDVLKELVE